MPEPQDLVEVALQIVGQPKTQLQLYYHTFIFRVNSNSIFVSKTKT